MSAEPYRSPSREEIAERLAAGELERPARPAPPRAPVPPPFVPEPAMTRPEPQPEVSGRLPRCEPCGYLREGVGHFRACVAPDGRPRWTV